MNLKLRNSFGCQVMLKVNMPARTSLIELVRTVRGRQDYDFVLEPSKGKFIVSVFNSEVADADAAYMDTGTEEMTFGEAIDYAVEFAAW